MNPSLIAALTTLGTLGTGVAARQVSVSAVNSLDSPVYEPPERTLMLVPTLNEAAYIGPTLESLQRQSVVAAYPERFLLAVVDSSSEDGTVDVARSMGVEVLEAPRGKLNARHEAMLQLARPGDVVMSLDADSVPSYSPVIIRSDIDGSINCVTFEELWDIITSPVSFTARGEEIKQVLGYSVYSGDSSTRYTRIDKIIRHPYNGPLLRFNCVGGLLDVSPNHSLIGFFGQGTSVLDAKSVKNGTRLSAPIFKPHVWKRFFYGTEGVAYLFGLFMAEGSACVFKDKRRDFVFDVSISNSNPRLLAESEREFKESFGLDVAGFSDGSKREDRTSAIHYRNRKLFEFLRPRFYDCRGKKRVPKEILNAPENIQESFIRGYLDGDGSDKSTTSYNRFSTNSWLLAQGMITLVESVSDRTFSIADRADKLDVVAVILNRGNNKEASMNNNWKPRGIVKHHSSFDYTGYLYDLSTDEGAFNCGIGQIRVHNTYYGPQYANFMLKHFQDPGVVGVYGPRLFQGMPILAPVEGLLTVLFSMPRRFHGSSSAYRYDAYLRAPFDLSIDQRDVKSVVMEEEVRFFDNLERQGKVVYERLAPGVTANRRWTGDDAYFDSQIRDRVRFEEIPILR